MEDAPRVDDTLVRLASAQDDLVALFAARAEAAGECVYHVDNNRLTDVVGCIVRAVAGKHVAVAIDWMPGEGELIERLRGAGVTVVDRDSAADALWELDVAVTGVRAAIAETGTLVCCSDGQQGRLLSLLAPVHIAIVRRSDIVPDMLDYWEQFDGQGPGRGPTSQVMITGPSKTSDIEGVLVVGVHGPGEVHVVIVDDR